MKISIMQPYFFPYLGYFDLILNTELFVVYDTVQYIKQGWISRNRILHPNKLSWLYIHVPVNRNSFDKSFKTAIVDVKIFDDKPWRQHILGQLLHYKQEAPYYEQVIHIVEESLFSSEESLSRLNVKILEKCAQYLGLHFNYLFSSDVHLEKPLDLTAEDRVLNLCDYFGAKEYVNLPGGVELYNPENFKAHDIKLVFRQLPTFVYDTGSYNFEPNLSIIDVLMWNDPKTVKNYLELHRGNGKNDKE